VCEHHEKLSETDFKCNGHAKASKKLPSYHGDMNREHRFWVYKDGRNLITPAWDFHRIPCDNSLLLKEDGDKFEY
jgi:hypothetical protein